MNSTCLMLKEEDLTMDLIQGEKGRRDEEEWLLFALLLLLQLIQLIHEIKVAKVEVQDDHGLMLENGQNDLDLELLLIEEPDQEEALVIQVVPVPGDADLQVVHDIELLLQEELDHEEDLELEEML